MMPRETTRWLKATEEEYLMRVEIEGEEVTENSAALWAFRSKRYLMSCRSG